MIARLIELSIRNKLLVLLLTAGLVAAGIWATLNSSIDAIPDLSDVQVIVITDYPGQAPDVVEDQVTYPLTTACSGIGAKAVRGFSMFETSMVYIIFPDGTDLHCARERVLEYLNYVQGPVARRRRAQARPGRDRRRMGLSIRALSRLLLPRSSAGASGTTQQPNKWYADPTAAPADRRRALLKVRGFDKPGACPLTGKPLVSSNQDLASLRSLQDWYLRYPLTGVPGVAEVASIGGFVKEYQVVLKPERLLAYNLPVGESWRRCSGRTTTWAARSSR